MFLDLFWHSRWCDGVRLRGFPSLFSLAAKKRSSVIMWSATLPQLFGAPDFVCESFPNDDRLVQLFSMLDRASSSMRDVSLTWLDETSLLLGNSLLNLFSFSSYPLLEVLLLHFQIVDFLKSIIWKALAPFKVSFVWEASESKILTCNITYKRG